MAADHGEMVLVAVQPGEEDDAGLVEAGRGGEDQARQRHGRVENVVEARLVAARERRERRGGGRRDRVEDAEERVGIALLVAGDQVGEVEVVAAYTCGRRAAGGGASRSPDAASSSEILMPSTFSGCAAMTASAVAMAAATSAEPQ